MLKTLLSAFWLSFAFTVVAQTNYYIAPTGNDNNDGSFQSPWKTIQNGIWNLSAGDTLNVRAGTYYEQLYVDTFGTSTKYITLRNYNGEEVTVSGANATNNDPLIYFDGAGYFHLEGIRFTDLQMNNARGIVIENKSHHIEIINNKVSKINFSSDPNAAVSSSTNAVPIQVLGDTAPDSVHQILIRGNEVFDNRPGYSENITLGGNVSGFVVEENHVHDNANIGIDVTGNYGEAPNPAYDHARYGVIKNNITHHNNASYSTAAGIYVDGGHHVIVENNLSHHNGYGGEIGCEQNGTANDVIFRNNIFYQNYYAGMHIGGYDVNTTGIVTHSKVYNNTFYLNDTGSEGNGELILSRSDNCSIFNNIFFINSQNVFLYAYREQQNMTMDYNLLYSTIGNAATIETTVGGNTSYEGLAAFYAATGYGANSLFAKPRFADASAFDFHLLATSPAINAGDPAHTPAPEEVDMDGESRQVEGITDIGADEYPLPLPVVYTTPLNAMVRKSGILLTWETGLEVNADKFILLRSAGSDWEIKAELPAGQHKYQILDTAPRAGINYYRLQQIDTDGKKTSSRIVTAFWRDEVRVFPNPTKGNVEFSGDRPHDVILYDLSNRIILRKHQVRGLNIPVKGIFILQFEDANLPPVLLRVE